MSESRPLIHSSLLRRGLCGKRPGLKSALLLDFLRLYRIGPIDPSAEAYCCALICIALDLRA